MISSVFLLKIEKKKKKKERLEPLNKGPKWQNTHFSQIFKQNAPCLKLFRDMPCFETRFLENQVSNIKLNFWTIKL